MVLPTMAVLGAVGIFPMNKLIREVENTLHWIEWNWVKPGMGDYPMI